MSAPDQWIPLFPLDLVLLPGEWLPLHIFEPRYRAMITRVEEEKLPFGVVWIRGGTLAEVGCLAQLERTIKRYPDGARDILSAGGERFRIAEVRRHGDEYFEARQQAVVDDGEAADYGVRKTLLHLLLACRDLEGSSEIGRDDAVLERDAQELPPGYSFAVAVQAGLEKEAKQELIEAVKESKREELLLGHLARRREELLGRAVLAKQVRGNGRAHPKSE